MLHPNLLWFLPLAVIPVLLHLITLRRLRTVELSTFRFLMDSYVQQRRRLKLLEYLIMLLRAGFIAACVVTVARPVIEHYAGLFGGRGGSEVAIVVDTGPSMGLRTNLTTSLQRAKDAARAIIGMVDDDVKVTVIRAGRDPQQLVSRFARQRQTILDQIENLQTDTAPGHMAAALDMIFESDPDLLRSVFLLTDGNRSGWSGLENHGVLEKLDERATLMIVNVGPTDPVANLSAVGDPPRSLRPIVGLPVQLTVTIVNSADKPADTVVSVVLDDRQINRLHLSLDPGEHVSRTVSATPTRSGIIQGRYELPGDDFPDDDTFMFCLNVEPHLNVLLVTDRADQAAPVDSDRYLRSVLAAPDHAARQLAHSDAQIAASLKLTTIGGDQLSEPQLDQADVVVLANAGLDEQKAQLLRRYVESGGGLLMFPGPKVSPSDVNIHLLTPTSRPDGKTPVPAALMEKPVGDTDDESRFSPVSDVDLTHPVFSAFDEPDAEYFKTVRLYRHFPIRLPPPTPTAPGSTEDQHAAQASVLMRLPDATAALVEIRLGAGKVLLAAVPATPTWSNLPLTGEFVAMTLRAVAYLRRPAPAAAPSTVRPHELAPITLTDRWTDAHVQVKDPDGRAHTIGLTRSGRQLVGAMSQTGRKGYYTFNVLPRTPSAPPRIELGFAVNLDTRKSSLEMFDEKKLRSLFAGPDGAPPANVRYLRGAPGDPVLHEQLRHKREIWRDLIIAAFVVILIEFLLSTLAPDRESAGDDSSSARPDRMMGRWRRQVAVVLRRGRRSQIGAQAHA